MGIKSTEVISREECMDRIRSELEEASDSELACALEGLLEDREPFKNYTINNNMVREEEQ